MRIFTLYKFKIAIGLTYINTFKYVAPRTQSPRAKSFINTADIRYVRRIKVYMEHTFHLFTYKRFKMYSHTLNDTRSVFSWTVYLVEILTLNSAVFHKFSVQFLQQTLVLNLHVSSTHPDPSRHIIKWIMQSLFDNLWHKKLFCSPYNKYPRGRILITNQPLM